MQSGENALIERFEFIRPPLQRFFVSGFYMISKSDITQRGLSAAKYTVVFKGLSQVILIIVNILLVRALSEHTYGVYNLFYSVIALTGMFASFGLPNTLQRYIPEYYARKEFKIAHRLYRMASALRLLSNVIAMGLILIFWEKTAIYLKIETYKYTFMFFVLIILLHLQRQLLEICLEAYFLQKYRHAVSIVFVSMRAVGYAFVILKGKDLWFILVIDLLAYLVTFFGLEIIYRKRIPKKEGQSAYFDKYEKARLVRYATYSNFNDAGVGLLGISSDIFIIAAYLDPVAVGAYAFCNRLSSICQRFSPLNYLLDVIRPFFFSVGTLSDSQKVKGSYQLLLKMNYLFYFPMFFFVSIFGQGIITVLFGGKFVAYSSVLTLVVFFSFLNSFALPMGLVAQLRERADIILYSKIFAGYNIIMDIILINYFGIWGAVLATGSAVLGKNFFVWYFVRNEATFRGTGPYFIIIALYWVSVSSIAICLKYVFLNQIIILITGIILFITAFVGQFRLSPFNKYERKALKQLIIKQPKLKWVEGLLRL